MLEEGLVCTIFIDFNVFIVKKKALLVVESKILE